MAVMRWRPVGGLLGIRDEVNRLFSEFLSTTPGTKDLLEGAWSPSVDVSETEKEIVVSAELAGINQEDVKVDVQNNVLTLSGEKKQEKEFKDESYHRVERSYGAFRRSVTLPAQVDVAKTKATYKNGVLKVTLPKSETAQPRQITVEVN